MMDDTNSSDAHKHPVYSSIIISYTLLVNELLNFCSLSFLSFLILTSQFNGAAD